MYQANILQKRLNVYKRTPFYKASSATFGAEKEELIFCKQFRKDPSY